MEIKTELTHEEVRVLKHFLGSLSMGMTIALGLSADDTKTLHDVYVKLDNKTRFGREET